MARSLKKLKKTIFFGELTDEEWLELNKEVQEFWKSATDEERQVFEDSGAGDLLTQIIEYIDCGLSENR
jgi:hypothetical protein